MSRKLLPELGGPRTQSSKYVALDAKVRQPTPTSGMLTCPIFLYRSGPVLCSWLKLVQKVPRSNPGPFTVLSKLNFDKKHNYRSKMLVNLEAF